MLATGLVFLVKTWSGAPPEPSSILSFKYDHHNETLSELEVGHYSMNNWDSGNEEYSLFECEQGGSADIKSGKLGSCLCRIDTLSELDNIVSDIHTAIGFEEGGSR